MAYTFVLNHKIVAYLSNPPPEYGIFKSMVRVLNSCKITKALNENPVMYRDLILEFWKNVKIVKSETSIETIVSKVKGVEVVVTEDVIRRVLEFGDQPDSPRAIADKEVEEILRMMSYEAETFTKFYEKFFPPYWRFLIHTFQVCFASRGTGVDVLNKSLVHAIVAFVRDLKFNFSYYIFDEMKKYVKKSNHKLVLFPRFVQLILNEMYPYIPRTGDSVDLKGVDSDIFRRMCMCRCNKEGLFTGRYPLVKFGRFANIEGENDNIVSAVDQDDVVEVAPTQPVVAEASAPIQYEIAPYRAQFDQPQNEEAPIQTEVAPEQPLFDQHQPQDVSESSMYTPREPEFVIAREDEGPLSNEDVENMIISQLLTVDPMRLMSVISDHSSLPPMELSDVAEVQASFNLNEPAQSEVDSTESIHEETEPVNVKIQSATVSEETESASNLILRKRKRSELDVQSSIIPRAEDREDVEQEIVEKETEDMLVTEKDNVSVVDMELDQSSIQEKIVEKETVVEEATFEKEPEVEKEAVVETANVDSEKENEMNAETTTATTVVPPESTPTTTAEVPRVQEKASGKAVLIEDSTPIDVPVITMDKMFRRAELHPIDPSVGGSGAGCSGVPRSPQRPVNPSFPANDGASDSNSDFDDADDDFEDSRQGRFLRKVIEKKDILLGTMDVRLHELEESDAAKTAEIASLKTNLGNLSASFHALQQLLCQRLGNEFNLDSIPLPTTTPASQPPPSSSTPQPPPVSSTQPAPTRTVTIVDRFDPNMERYVNSVPVEAQRRKKYQEQLQKKKEKEIIERQRLKEKARKEKAIRRKVDKIVQDSDIVIVKDRDYRRQPIGGREPESYVMAKKRHITDT
ncbi:hypothetical protein OROHE_000866 [Orobanche hederae]